MRFLFRLLLAVLLTALVAVVAFRLSAYAREVATASELVTPESRMIETVHGVIHALEAGPEDGVPIVLIHGSVGWAGLWRTTIDTLAEQGYRVVAIDLPPMGLSERNTRQDFSRQAQALRILAATEALEIEPIIVAHSFGAGAAVEALMVEPQLFRGGVIVAGALSLGTDEVDADLPWPLRPVVLREAALAATVTNPYVSRWLFRQFVHRKDAIDASVVASLEYPFRRAGTTETLAAWLPTLLTPPEGAASTDPARYAALGMPVALIWGREDTVTPPEQAGALDVALGGVPLFWLNDVGHIPQIEAPDAFHEALGAALTFIEES